MKDGKNETGKKRGEERKIKKKTMKEISKSRETKQWKK